MIHLFRLLDRLGWPFAAWLLVLLLAVSLSANIMLLALLARG